MLHYVTRPKTASYAPYLRWKRPRCKGETPGNVSIVAIVRPQVSDAIEDVYDDNAGQTDAACLRDCDTKDRPRTDRKPESAYPCPTSHIACLATWSHCARSPSTSLALRRRSQDRCKTQRLVGARCTLSRVPRRRDVELRPSRVPRSPGAVHQ